MRTSPHLGLRIWNLLLDPYDHEQLADNWAKVDAHDHSEGRGVLIPTEGIADEAIDFGLLAPSVFPEVSVEGGELTLETEGEEQLAAGPELKVKATGTYEVGLQLRAESIKESAYARGWIAVNNVFSGPEPQFDTFLPEHYSTFTTNFVRHSLIESDELTVYVATTGIGHIQFTRGRISLLRVA